MRKISNMFMLVAAAAMTFVSCQKEENRAPETVSATLTLMRTTLSFGARMSR